MKGNGCMPAKFNSEALYALLRSLPEGVVITYGDAAALLGNRKWSRAVGNALHKNPDGEGTPCYKVVNRKGELSSSYAFGGISEQCRRLEADGIEVLGNKVDLKRYGFNSSVKAEEDHTFVV